MFFRVVSFNGPQRFTSGSLYTNFTEGCGAGFQYGSLSFLVTSRETEQKQLTRNKNSQHFLSTFTIARDDVLKFFIQYENLNSLHYYVLSTFKLDWKTTKRDYRMIF